MIMRQINWTSVAREWLNGISGAFLVVALLYSTRQFWLHDLIAEADSTNTAEIEPVNVSTALVSGLSRDAPSVGSGDAKHSIIVFSDYFCSVCRTADAELGKILKDKDIKLYIRELPVLGKESKDAAKIALTSFHLGKYEVTRQKLFGKSHGNGWLESYLNANADIAVNYNEKNEQVKVEEHIVTSLKAAHDLGIEGTPAFIIDGKLFRGWDKAKITEEIEKMANSTSVNTS